MSGSAQGAGARERMSDESGFTLVEIVVAAAILLVGVLGVLTLLNTANANTHKTKVRDGATSLAREMIEAARAVPYPDLTETTVEDQIKAQPGLDDATGGGTWHIQRRGLDYAVTATVCSVDGPADGLGDHSGGSFCTDSSGTGNADTNPDDYKRVAVVVSWQNSSGTTSVRQEAVINDPGSAFAPSVTVMKPSSTSPITISGTTSVTFSPVTTSSKAQSVRWYVDNVQRGLATAVSGNDWKFTWDLNGVADGTYQVRAQAFDRYGQTGAGYVVTMVLNRFPPAVPRGVIGGRNGVWGNLVELEWDPNPERDVTGYEVYRVKGGAPSVANDIKVCSTLLADANPTSCVDPDAPAGNQRYYVVALAPARPPATGSESSGLPGTLLNSDTSNVAPLAPPAVTATALAGGGIELSWTAATDPDSTPILYYRIYRDGNASYTARYDHTDAGTTLSWSDTSPNAAAHRYWVTAVDDHLAESPLSPNGGITP